jgi:hypothetical protein
VDELKREKDEQEQEKKPLKVHHPSLHLFSFSPPRSSSHQLVCRVRHVLCVAHVQKATPRRVSFAEPGKKAAAANGAASPAKKPARKAAPQKKKTAAQ